MVILEIVPRAHAGIYIVPYLGSVLLRKEYSYVRLIRVNVISSICSENEIYLREITRELIYLVRTISNVVSRARAKLIITLSLRLSFSLMLQGEPPMNQGKESI